MNTTSKGQLKSSSERKTKDAPQHEYDDEETETKKSRIKQPGYKK